jgi:type II secretory pathway component PulF
MPMLRAGEQLSEVLAAKKVLPAEFVRSFRVAEKAGELDAELTVMAQRTEEMAVAALKRWSEWLPRILYAGVLFYAAWMIVQTYANYLGQVNKIDPFNQ